MPVLVLILRQFRRCEYRMTRLCNGHIILCKAALRPHGNVIVKLDIRFNGPACVSTDVEHHPERTSDQVRHPHFVGEWA